MPCDRVAVMTATLLTADAREILENRTTLEALVAVLKAALEREDIAIHAYNAATQTATLKVGNAAVYVGGGRISVQDPYGRQSDVDELGETVEAVAKMLAGRLRSNRVVEALKTNNVPIVSDNMVGTARVVKILL